MSEYVFLFRGGTPPGSPELTQQRMQKWIAWMKELTEKGQLKDPGHPLEPTGKVVRGERKTATDGPFAETKDIIGRYLVIEAKDIAQALEISKGCPIFDVDGLVEVRPVLKMSM